MVCCPTCGALMKDSREGVRLTAIKIRIFDLVSRRPGIARAEIAGIIYGEVTTARKLTVSAHLYQIRDAFLDHPKIKIVGVSGHGYRIVHKPAVVGRTQRATAH